MTDLSNGYKNIVNNGLSQVCKIKVKENRMEKSKMDKPDPQATLDARHRTKTNTTKQKHFVPGVSGQWSMEYRRVTCLHM